MIRARYPAKQSKKTRVFGLAAAAIFTVMAVTQLIGFERMPDTLSIFWPANLGSGALPLAAFLVVCEVFALPFLLAMRLSVLARICSFFVGCLVIVYCFAATINAFSSPEFSSGILGSYVTMSGGVTVLLFTIVTTVVFGGYVATLPRRQS